MPMIVTCPCGRQLQLDEQYAGTRVRCPICQQIFQAPGPAIGDFQMENAAPTSEPPPHVAASVPARQPDPTIFDLAPSHPGAAAPTRPRSRPVVRHARDEASPTKSRRITRILDVCAGLLLLGAIITVAVSIHRLAVASAPTVGSIVGVLLGSMLMVAGGLWFLFRLILIFRH